MGSTRIVIVNYRTARLVADSLRSLVPEVQANPGLRVTVVDGGSGDGAAEQLAEAIRTEGWMGWADLLPLAENRGFAAANNAALRLLLTATNPPDYVAAQPRYDRSAGGGAGAG